MMARWYGHGNVAESRERRSMLLTVDGANGTPFVFV